MNATNIPSAEDFARARAAMRARDTGLGEIRENILARWPGVFAQVFLMYSEAHDTFVLYLFLSDGVDAVDAADVIEAVRLLTLGELRQAGRATADHLELEVEIDTDRNVRENYEGDYYLRLR